MQKEPPAWTNQHTEAIKRIKERCVNLPPTQLPNEESTKVLEIDASTDGWGAILKQNQQDANGKQVESICDYASRIWKGA